MKCVYDVCGWEYDEAASFPRNGIASGSPNCNIDSVSQRFVPYGEMEDQGYGSLRDLFG